jgi:hypothetical protein
MNDYFTEVNNFCHRHFIFWISEYSNKIQKIWGPQGLMVNIKIMAF